MTDPNDVFLRKFVLFTSDKRSKIADSIGFSAQQVVLTLSVPSRSDGSWKFRKVQNPLQNFTHLGIGRDTGFHVLNYRAVTRLSTYGRQDLLWPNGREPHERPLGCTHQKKIWNPEDFIRIFQERSLPFNWLLSSHLNLIADSISKRKIVNCYQFYLWGPIRFENRIMFNCPFSFWEPFKLFF